ncbi:phosphoribosylpyrophosphate synthetase [Psychroserpens mesophilus]|uniref:phosphoribosylpyrophosphate synthetase n=1 Tax=Psychroserpens mesophilus TaxID=325473 RepID=UPI003D654B99
MKNYSTLSVTMNRLKADGYNIDFNLSGYCIHCPSEQLKLSPSEFQIDKFFRFEGQSDPADGAILYAISSEKYNLKGVLVNGYGIYSEPLTNEMLAKLKTH